MDDESIESLLAKIAAEPNEVQFHQQLRAAAIRRKSVGAPKASMLKKALPWPCDPLKRLVHVERLSANDPGDLDLLLQVAQTLEQLATARRQTDFAPAIAWVAGVLGLARKS